MKTVSKVSVIGLGYIGLPTAAVFADRGVEVVGVDVTESVVQRINAGEPHFVEPNLAALVRRVVEAGKLRASLTPEPADVFIVAVPTPFQDIEGHHWPDVSYIERAARAIAPVLKPGNLVILESTSPVGTTERMCGWMAEERPDLTFPTQKGETSDIRVAHCPERVLPGKILDEVVNNARVIGGITRKCAQQALQVYKIICEGECRPTGARTAEHLLEEFAVVARIAAKVLAEKLAACATLIPGATSLYYWEGKLEQEYEVQMILKTTVSHQQALLECLKSHHPYQTPELLVLPVTHGDTDYLSWLNASLR